MSSIICSLIYITIHGTTSKGVKNTLYITAEGLGRW